MLVLLSVLAACDDTNNLSIGDDTGHTTAIDDTGTTSVSDESPLIEVGTIYCAEGSNSSGDIFYVELTGSDPQGPDTIAAFGNLVAAYDGSGVQMFEDAILVCDDRGRCTGTFRDGVYPSVVCTSHSLFTYTAQLVDEDDNWSEVFQLVWKD